MMTDDELTAIEARANAADKGEWRTVPLAPDDKAHVGIYGPHALVCRAILSNAEFIAHSRTDIPALVAEVRRLQTDRDDVVARERKRCLSLVGCMAGEPLKNAIRDGEELT